MASHSGGMLKKADPKTIQDKFLVGYQGWFTCGGDGPPVHSGHHGWLHWFDRPISDGGRPNMDLWPDVSAYSPSELFPAPGLTLPTGQPACLFSSRHPRTVHRHFHWMAEHGVDGCFLQRFASQVEAEGNQRGAKADLMRLRDEIGDRVKEAAEQEGRVFAIMYDVSGVPADQLQRVLEVDWNHLIRDRALLDSPNYLREQGKPVVAIWGVGFAKSNHNPIVITQIIRNMRNMTPGGAYIMAGTPTNWQTLEGDADPNPAFLDLYYKEFDAISPWTVGRYRDLDSADKFAAHKIKNDMQAIQDNCHGRKIDYIPVVWPGGSEHNLSNKQREPNFAPREGGKFLWRQIFNAKREGARILYGAMWDEYDEGTALMPAESYKHNLPLGGRFLSLDMDGYDLPSDWYMRICGMAAEGLRSERLIHDTFPKKELDDYWSSRPKFVEGPADASGSGSKAGYQDWLNIEKKKEKEKEKDVPPPPYSLESSGSPIQPTPPPVPPCRSSSGANAQSAQPSVLLSTRPAVTPQHAATEGNTETGERSHALADRPAVSQGPFVGGFGQGQERLTQPPRPATAASTFLVDEFNRHTLADASAPIESRHASSPHSSPPPIPAHSRPPLSPFSSSSSSNENSWSQTQFPPPEWNLQSAQDASSHPLGLGYPAPHSAPSQPIGLGYPSPHSAPSSAGHSYAAPHGSPSQPSGLGYPAPYHTPSQQSGLGYPAPHSHYSPPPVPSRQSSSSAHPTPPAGYPQVGWNPPSNHQSYQSSYPKIGEVSYQSYPQDPSFQQGQPPYGNILHSSQSEQPYGHTPHSPRHGQFPYENPPQSTQQGQSPYGNPSHSPQQGQPSYGYSQPGQQGQYPQGNSPHPDQQGQPQYENPSQSPYSPPPPPSPPRLSPPGPGVGPPNSAWSVVDKVAGKERRKKLEQSVGSVVQTGTKLLNQYKAPFGK